MANNLACYIRLSLADGDLSSFKDESNSIRNQRDLIHKYIETHEDFKDWNVLEFVDDGYTGTNTDRPEFQRMLELTRQRQIHCILVKDLSRFARNYVVCGEYLEEVFPFLGVRFIAINDNYDSSNSTSIEDNMSMVLKSVLNAYYSKDISRKISSAFHQRMRQGTFRCQAPFGYKKVKETNHFQLDPEAASIVRKVFDLALSGKKTTEIADAMNKENYPTPAVYNKRHIPSKRHAGRILTDDPVWENSMVLGILRNPTYTGDMIMRKAVPIVPGSKKRRPAKPEEQFVQKDFHEAIVTHEEFDRVQEAFPKRSAGKHRNTLDYPLKGVVRCGYCKRAMSLPAKSTVFVCDHSRQDYAPCIYKKYEASEIELVVMQSLRPMISLVVQSERKTGSNHNKNRVDILLQCQKEISKLEYSERRIKQLKLDAYEDYASGKLSLEDYQIKRDALTTEGDTCSKKLSALREQEASFNKGIVPHSVQSISDAAHKYQHNTSLSREMVQAFVESVYCFEDHYEIVWKFQDVWNQIL